MYQSPIDIIHGELEMQLEGEVYKAVQRVGVNVDKEELLKALQYDREQYKRGYEDGYAKAIEECAVALKEKCKEKMDVFGFGTLDVWEINKIAKELKKNSNETQTEMKGE